MSFNFTNPPIWSLGEMGAEKERHLAADLAALGPRPGWWRPRARGRHDRAVACLKRAHASDLRVMITSPDSLHRAITAHLIGWQPPHRGATR